MDAQAWPDIARDPEDALHEIEALVVTPDFPESDVNALILAIIDAKALAEAASWPWESVRDAARAKLSDVMAATGRSDWKVPAGRAYVPAAGVSVSYDAKALDALCASSPEIASILGPHRRETMRAGSLTIKGTGR